MITPFVGHFVTVRDGPLEKLWGRWGIFEPQELSFVIKFLILIFLAHSMNLF